ncbi:hypothetical protein RRG08_027815 [Elysia crispata]|uniref:Uncharacterized protein n=1 Tax=Elysia crispata TaxID=231223 RepID=A0AAE0YVS4_9GAST|nr:hypothetical protein RRG08_027815 [Elysia crispata]
MIIMFSLRAISSNSIASYPLCESRISNRRHSSPKYLRNISLNHSVPNALHIQTFGWDVRPISDCQVFKEAVNNHVIHPTRCIGCASFGFPDDQRLDFRDLR